MEHEFSHLNAPEYDEYRRQVDIWHGNKKSRACVDCGLRNDENQLLKRLQEWHVENGWPLLEPVEWRTLVAARWERLEEEKRLARIAEEASQDAIVGEIHGNFSVPRDPKSAWSMYEAQALSDWRQEEVDLLRKSVFDVLQRLSRETRQNTPIKGLVVGHVQSGKTAHMAGLMAMAADNGFNFFINLTGVIDNLRKQTQRRLFDDLRHEGCNLTWTSLEHLSTNSPHGNRLQDLHVQSTSNARFMTSVLKNSTRLRSLLDWFRRCPDKWQHLRILVIDDEADQASVNTAVAKDRRTTIFGMLQEIVELSDHGTRPAAMNYIGYTATPYGILLNDGSTGSLYPTNFLAIAPRSMSYFGPSQIFGCEQTGEPGLNIVRTVSAEDIERVRQIHNGEKPGMPECLRHAICWFCASVGVQRHWGYGKPVTMLVHTSMRQEHHRQLGTLIQDFLAAVETEVLLREIERIYNYERAKFTIQDLRNGFVQHDYGAIEHVRELPAWQDISEETKALLEEQVSHVPLDAEGEVEPHGGINLCIDNSANDHVAEESTVRLVYPEPLGRLGFCPAYLVIGGNTLSRGLTIEGLICTFFLRSSGQVDTLMQMGRWFGFRRDYELLPRLWLTSKTKDRFCYMATIEQDFREQVKVYESGVTPGDQATLVLSPESRYGAAFKIAARNKTANATHASYDFQGVVPQTTAFIDDPDIQQLNVTATERFLDRLEREHTKSIRTSSEKTPSAVVIEGVPFCSISDYLQDLQIARHRNTFGRIEKFIEWYESATSPTDGPSLTFADWNVVVGSTTSLTRSVETEATDRWSILGHRIPKVRRTRLATVSPNSEEDVFSIGALRDPRHVAIDGNAGDHVQQLPEYLTVDAITQARAEAGVSEVPQLLIYMIRGDSVPDERSAKAREPLWRDYQRHQDVIGLSIIIPGARQRGTAVRHLEVGNLPLGEDALDIEDSNGESLD